ncbi:MAG: SPOR domain-containing protein [Blastocatellia bacterium]
MFKALRNLNSRDKLALTVFFSLALLCTLYFASGILVTYISSSAAQLEMSKDGTGFTVQAHGLQSKTSAEQLVSELKNQHNVTAEIVSDSVSSGYMVKIGPLTKLDGADYLRDELHKSGYSVVKIVQNCAPGIADCNPTQLPATPNQPAGKGK